MGGKKKVSLKQMESIQRRKGGSSKKTKPPSITKEKKSFGVTFPNINNKKIINDVKKIRVITPHIAASRFNLRISVAKEFLVRLEESGMIKFVSGNHKIKLYTPLD